MIIPGFIFSIIFAPGLPVHELSHYIMCLLCGIKVRKVKWWGLKGAYLAHDRPKRLFQSILISIAPFIISNLIAAGFMLLGLAVSAASFHLGIFFLWIGVSAAFFSFPSLQDAKNAIKEMEAFMGSNWKRHRKEMGKDGMAAVKVALDIVFGIFVYLPITAVLLAMVVVNYFPILSLGWVYLLMLMLGMAPPLLI